MEIACLLFNNYYHRCYLQACYASDADSIITALAFISSSFDHLERRMVLILLAKVVCVVRLMCESPA